MRPIGGRKMIKIVLSTLAATFAVQTVAVNYAFADGDHKKGAIIGGIIGGIIGNKNSKDKAAGTIIGALIGAMVGAEIGRYLEENDRRAISHAYDDSWHHPVGYRSSWRGYDYGSRSGAYGEVVSVREGYHSYTGEMCREVRSSVWVAGRTETTTTVTCTRRDGSWHQVRIEEVRWAGGGYDRREEHRDNWNNGGGWNNGGWNNGNRWSQDLRGRCYDQDHSQFMQAKSFAYSGNGLNMTDSNATQWAFDFNNSHNCGTINEFAARFNALYSYAYSGDLLNMNTINARDFALSKADTVSVQQVERMKVDFKDAFRFAYDGDKLNYNSQKSNFIARSWVERNCSDKSAPLAEITNSFQREYNFAYSGSGLNMNSQNARQYALDRIRNLSACSDLFY